MNTDLSKFKRYAEEVINGDRPSGLYQRQACKRYLDLFNRKDIEFRPEKAIEPVNLIQKLKLSGDRFENQPFKLEPWQKFIIYAIYGFYYKGTDDRVIQRAYILISRKNGKTALCSALALYHLLMGENGQEVVCGANSKDQATLLKDSTKKFIDKLPKPIKNNLHTFRSLITFKQKDNKLKVLSSDAATLDGLNPSVGIIDEYHAAKNSDLYNVIKTGQLMRSNPLMFIISTAGVDLTSPCYTLELYSRQVLDGQISDDRFFCCMWEIDKGDKPEDEKNWYKASPNLGVSIRMENMRSDFSSATQQGGTELAHFLTKNLNCWLKGGVSWISPDIVDKYSESIKNEFFYDKEVYIGYDLSKVRDMTALTIFTVYNDIYYFKNFYYLPKGALDTHPLKATLTNWESFGYITLTPGETVDYEYVREKIKEFERPNEGGYIKKISFDKWNADTLSKELTEIDGLPCKPFSQSIGNFNRPTKEFERLLFDGKVRLDNNPITAWMIGNVSIKEDNNGNAKPEKEYRDSARKVDGVISILQSLGGYLDDNIGEISEIFVI